MRERLHQPVASFEGTGAARPTGARPGRRNEFPPGHARSQAGRCAAGAACVRQCRIRQGAVPGPVDVRLAGNVGAGCALRVAADAPRSGIRRRLGADAGAGHRRDDFHFHDVRRGAPAIAAAAARGYHRQRAAGDSGQSACGVGDFARRPGGDSCKHHHAGQPDRMEDRAGQHCGRGRRAGARGSGAGAAELFRCGGRAALNGARLPGGRGPARARPGGGDQ